LAKTPADCLDFFLYLAEKAIKKPVPPIHKNPIKPKKPSFPIEKNPSLSITPTIMVVQPGWVAVRLKVSGQGSLVLESIKLLPVTLGP
jgi:hypothetical protein